MIKTCNIFPVVLHNSCTLHTSETCRHLLTVTFYLMQTIGDINKCWICACSLVSDTCNVVIMSHKNSVNFTHYES